MPTEFTMAQLHWRLTNDKTCVNRFAFQEVAGAIPEGDLPEFAGDVVLAASANNILDRFAQDLQLTQIGVQNYIVDAGPPVHITPTTVEYLGPWLSSPGTDGGNSVAPQLSTVLSVRTAAFAPEVHGRIYLPQPPESVTAPDGRLIGDYPDDTKNTFTGFITSCLLSGVFTGGKFGVVSRTADSFEEFLSIWVDDVARTQRRRALRT